jgi:hypothetical protein
MAKVARGSVFWIVDAPGSELLPDWFRNCDPAPRELAHGGGSTFHFNAFGPLQRGQDGEFVAHLSPLVNVFTPTWVRGAIWTCAEVHFLTIGSAPAGKEMARIKRQFSAWLSSRHVIADRQNPPVEDFSYFLAGSIINFASRVFATDAGLAALRSDQFVVDRSANEAVIDTLCQRLRLLGIDCASSPHG